MSPDPKPSDDKPTPRKLYVAYAFQANRRTALASGAVEVQGRVTWTLNLPSGQPIDQLLQAWDDRGYKMGLLVQKGQRIESLAYAGLAGPAVTLQPNTTFVADLGATLGTPDGYEWLAFGGKGRRKYAFLAPNIIDFDVTLRITNTAKGPQLVPVASRHLDGPFSESYMGGLWVL